jgi:hypothetical protein
VVGEQRTGWKDRLAGTFKRWAPYLVMFVGAGIWRVFLFPYTQNNYKLSFIEQFKTNPLAAVGGLFGKVIEQNVLVSWEAWRQVISRPDASQVLGVPGGLGGYWGILAGTAVGVFAALWGQTEEKDPWRALRQRWGWAALALGVLSLLLAGWPFWLTDVPFRLEFAYDRFTLPYMLGVSLILAGLVDLLPLWRVIKLAGLAGLVALGVGWQMQVGASFIKDWQVEQDFFNQLAWRAPGLQPGTTVIVNELRIRPTDNSLTGPLNWIYAPGSPQGTLKYLLAYPSLRLGSPALPKLEKGLPIYKDYLVGEFKGSTDQVLAFYTNPGDCLRMLYPQDANDKTLPDQVREMARISQPALIQVESPAVEKPLISGILGQPPSGTWCEIYEKAARAAQRSDWSEVTRLGNLAGDIPKKAHTPTELFPFIEGYAFQAGVNPDYLIQAVGLIFSVIKDEPRLNPQICTMLAKITGGGIAVDGTTQREIKNRANCFNP